MCCRAVPLENSFRAPWVPGIATFAYPFYKFTTTIAILKQKEKIKYTLIGQSIFKKKKNFSFT